MSVTLLGDESGRRSCAGRGDADAQVCAPVSPSASESARSRCGYPGAWTVKAMRESARRHTISGTCESARRQALYGVIGEDGAIRDAVDRTAFLPDVGDAAGDGRVRSSESAGGAQAGARVLRRRGAGRPVGGPPMGDAAGGRRARSCGAGRPVGGPAVGGATGGARAHSSESAGAARADAGAWRRRGAGRPVGGSSLGGAAGGTRAHYCSLVYPVGGPSTGRHSSEYAGAAPHGAGVLRRCGAARVVQSAARLSGRAR